MSAIFPTLSVKPDSSTFIEEQDDPGETIRTEGGYEITRPKYRRRPRKTFTFGYEYIRYTEAQQIQALWDEVKGSASAFSWSHPFNGGAYMVRFVEKFQVQYDYGSGDIHYVKIPLIKIKEV